MTGSGHTVLVVEDHPNQLGALVRVLRAAGYEVLEARSADEARNALRNAPQVGVAVVDLGLPDSSGGALLEEFRERRGLKVVVVTGQPGGLAEHGANDPRVTAFLRKPLSQGAFQKPVDPEVLLFAVGNAVRIAVLEGHITRLISPEVFSALDKDPGSLEPRHANVAVGFADIRGFTSLSNKLETRQVGTLLGVFFSAACQCIEQEGGFIDKFVGDEVIWFHHNKDLRDSTEACLRVAVDFMKHVAEMEGRVQDALGQRVPVPVGIGVACGTVAMGLYGARSHRVQFSVLGPAVNLASRLCSEAKGGEILVGGEAKQYSPYRTEFIAFRTIKGFDNEVRLDRVLWNQ